MMLNRQYPEYYLDPSTTHILKPFGKSKKVFCNHSVYGVQRVFLFVEFLFVSTINTQKAIKLFKDKMNARLYLSQWIFLSSLSRIQFKNKEFQQHFRFTIVFYLSREVC